MPLIFDVLYAYSINICYCTSGSGNILFPHQLVYRDVSQSFWQNIEKIPKPPMVGGTWLDPRRSSTCASIVRVFLFFLSSVYVWRWVVGQPTTPLPQHTQAHLKEKIGKHALQNAGARFKNKKFPMCRMQKPGKSSHTSKIRKQKTS